MKRLLLFLMVFVSLFTLSSCNDKTPTSTPTPTNPETQAPTENKPEVVADSEGFVIHYVRPDSEYTDWNLWLWVEGGEGAVELAELVVKTIEENPSGPLTLAYSDDDDVVTKINKVAQNQYGARQVTLSPTAKKKLAMIEQLGYSHFPICIAKTQYSFSTNAKLINVPKDFDFHVQDIVINAGAEMLVVISGEIMRMPGLPKVPQAMHIDIVNGEIEGLS